MPGEAVISTRDQDTQVLLPAASIERAAARIEGIARERVMGTALDIGRVVLDEIYGGELDSWRSRGRKDPSFKRLGRVLEKRGRGVSASTIYRACGLVELEDRVGVSTLKRLTASHGFAVLGLPGPVQKQLLERAANEELSVRALQALAAGQRPKRKAGRQAKPRFVKSFGRLRKMLDEEGFADLGAVEQLDEEQARSLLNTAEEMRARLDEITSRVQEHLDDR